MVTWYIIVIAVNIKLVEPIQENESRYKVWDNQLVCWPERDSF